MDTPIAEQLAALRTENDRLKAWARDVVSALAKARSDSPDNAPANPPLPQRRRVLPDDTARLFENENPQLRRRQPERDRTRFSTTLRMAAEQYEILAFEHEQLSRQVAEKDAELAELRARVRNLRRALSAVEGRGPEIPPFLLPDSSDSLMGLNTQPMAE